jgi:chitinase
MKLSPFRPVLLILATVILCLGCVTTPEPEAPELVEPLPGGRPPESAPDRPGPQVLAGWYASWSAYGRDFPVQRIEAGKLTHLYFAFASLEADGAIVPDDPAVDVERVFGVEPEGLAYHGHFAQLQALRAANPGLKLVVSLGGSAQGGRFAALAADPVERQRLAAAAVDFLERYGFDGLDLDWEFPVRADRENVLALVTELRASLGQRWLSLSIGATAARLEGLDLPALAGLVDVFNLMAYDFHGGWDRRTGHQSALYPDPDDPAVRSAWLARQYNVRDAVNLCLQAGVPPKRLVLGCPAYGRAWLVADSAGDDSGEAGSDGRFLPARDEKPAGTWQAGTYDWDDLRDEGRWLPERRHFDPQSGASWYFDPASGLFVSYDDDQAVLAKARFVREWGLGGMSFWHLGADTGGSRIGLAGDMLFPSGWSAGP